MDEIGTALLWSSAVMLGAAALLWLWTKRKPRPKYMIVKRGDRYEAKLHVGWGTYWNIDDKGRASDYNSLLDFHSEEAAGKAIDKHASRAVGTVVWSHTE